MLGGCAETEREERRELAFVLVLPIGSILAATNRKRVPRGLSGDLKLVKCGIRQPYFVGDQVLAISD